MNRETERLIRLVNDLLVLTRADAGALNLQLAPLDLGELARSRCEHLQAAAEPRQVRLRSSCLHRRAENRRLPGAGRCGPDRPGAGQPAGQRHPLLARRARCRAGWAWNGKRSGRLPGH